MIYQMHLEAGEELHLSPTFALLCKSTLRKDRFIWSTVGVKVCVGLWMRAVNKL